MLYITVEDLQGSAKQVKTRDKFEDIRRNRTEKLKFPSRV